jgi:hypothetical protein
MVWGVELYGPTEIESLYLGMKKLGWMRVGAFNADDSAVNHIRRRRSYGSGGWMNIGRVSPKGEHAPSLLAKNFAPLPPGVESLLARVFHITPSLTAVLIGFQLQESLASLYECEINRDRRTIRRRAHRPRTIELLGPGHQKREAVVATRHRLRRTAGHWFACHLPGYFCGLKVPTDLPTMELLVGRGLDLSDTDSPSRGMLHGWPRLLLNVPPHELWTDNGHSGLQLAFEQHRDKDEGSHLVVALDTKTFSEEATKQVGGRKATAYSWICNEILSGTLVHVATIEYLKEHTRDIHLTRQNLRNARSGRRHVSRTLDEIGLFFDRTIGSPAIFSELAKNSGNEGWYRHDCGSFTNSGWRDEDKKRKLYDVIRRQVFRLSSHLAEEEARLRGHFEQLSTILSIRESIKAQRRMELLTVLVLLVAFASLVIAMPRLSEAANKIESLWHSGVAIMRSISQN